MKQELEEMENSYLYLLFKDEQNTKLSTYHQLYGCSKTLIYLDIGETFYTSAEWCTSLLTLQIVYK